MKHEKHALSQNTLRRYAAALTLLASFAYIILAPRYFLPKLGTDPIREFYIHREEPTSCIINVWHIVTFKPYVGSLGSWLDSRAQKYSERYIGIYFSVKSYSPEEAESELRRGNRPDIISFAGGTLDEDMLFKGSAQAYCASGKLILYEPNSVIGLNRDDMISSSGTAQEFKAGKVPSCITDIRGAGDLYRAELLGKCPFFEAEPYDDGKPLVQYIGLYSAIDVEKIQYAEGFIEYILSAGIQSLISNIGLIPVDPDAEVKYDTDWLYEVYKCFDAGKIPPWYEKTLANE